MYEDIFNQIRNEAKKRNLLLISGQEKGKFPLNKIAARWPAKAVAQFSLTTNKSSGSTFRNSVLLSYDTKQLNTESSTAYENNSIYRRLPQSEL